MPDLFVSTAFSAIHRVYFSRLLGLWIPVDEKLPVILSAYADDSGSDENSVPPAHYFVLAGYILPVETWKPFSDRWAEELKRNPPIKCFKMRDAEYGDGYFQGMQEPFRKLKVNELAQVICDFQPIPISAHLKWNEYETIVKGRAPEKLDSPYAILFYQLIKKSHDIQIAVNQNDPSIGFHRVDFALDDQGKIGLRALQWYEKLRDVLPEPYKGMAGNTPAFRDDKEIVALQAADMIAWHIHRYLENPDEDRPVMAKIANLHEGSDITAETLQQFVENTKRVNLDELNKGF